MKNLQKGSATLWMILIAVLVLVGGGLYIFNSNRGSVSGCRITDSSGKTTFGPCPEAPSGKQPLVQSEFDKIGQAMKVAESKYLKSPPPGFLIPTTMPNGYKPQSDPSLFEADYAGYFYSTGRGVPADKNIEIDEYGSSHVTFGNFSDYMARNMKDPALRLVKEFSYNGRDGKIFTSKMNANPNYELDYDNGGKGVVRIWASNDIAISPDNLIDILKAMTIVK